MAIEFRCPTCEKLLRTPDSTAGKQGRCPHCQSLMHIPKQAAASASSAPPDEAPVHPPEPAATSGASSAPMPPPEPPPPPMPPPAPMPAAAPLAPAAPSYTAPSAASPTGDLLSGQPAKLEPRGPAPSLNEGDLFAGLGAGASAPQSYPASGGEFPKQPYGGGYTSGAPAPTAPFNAPAYAAPSYGAPAYTAPAYSAPSYGAPSPAMPAFNNPYAAPMSGYGGRWGSGMAPHRGNTILTLGIIGLVTNVIGFLTCCCCAPLYFVFGIASIAMGVPAWIMANSDLRAMREGRMDPSGQGSTKTGMILGIICVALTVLSLIAMVALYAFGFAMNFSEFQRGFDQGFEQSFDEEMDDSDFQ